MSCSFQRSRFYLYLHGPSPSKKTLSKEMDLCSSNDASPSKKRPLTAIEISRLTSIGIQVVELQNTDLCYLKFIFRHIYATELYIQASSMYKLFND